MLFSFTEMKFTKCDKLVKISNILYTKKEFKLIGVDFMKKNIGFIGSGNMATAMIGGILNANLVEANQIICSNPTNEKLTVLKDKYHILTTTNNCEVASKADILFLSIKPATYKEVIEEIKDKINDNTIIVVIAAGQKISNVKDLFGKNVKIIRSMPNTPALVGEGMAAICPSPEITQEELTLICNIFNSIGEYDIVSEKLMDVVTAISGSAPAFIFMIIESLADGAVLEGMPRDKAYKLAAQTVLGSAKMVLDTKKHPGELKDMVTSPGGTTIEGVKVLEKHALRSSFIEAIHKVTKKSKDLSK